MFGYVKVFKPQLRICEYETYKAVYCGLCKHIGKEYGLVPRMALSYDFAFLTLSAFSLCDRLPAVKPCRCIAHPLKKRPCAFCDEGYDYPSAAAQILIYHKLRDDVADGGVFKKLTARFMLLFMKKGYKKARGKYPALAESIEYQMKLQLQAEKTQGISIDEAIQPSACIMENIAQGLSDNETKKPLLKGFGYFIGRFVYLCDAADDLRSDLKKGEYNPLIKELELGEDISESDCARIKDYVRGSVNMTLAELADRYVKLDMNGFRPILDNIIYLGLGASCDAVLDKHFTSQPDVQNS